MKLKPISLLFPLGVLIVGALGNLFTFAGLTWYKVDLIKPAALTPPDWAFSVAWTLIFIAATISGLIVWNTFKKPRPILLLFLLNGVLNVEWSLLFFKLHAIGWALAEMLLLEATIIALHFMTWKNSKTASLLLLPYSLWVAFATLLTYEIMILQ